MKISIITINLNNVTGLHRTMESVMSQTYENIEYIIIDGGSSDGSLDVIRDYSDRLSYWISESDNGIYSAMNKGIKAASGEYINFLNSGDLYSSDLVLEIVANTISNSKAKLFFGNYIYFNSVGNRYQLCNIPEVRYKPDLLYYLFAHPSTFYNRELFYEVGTFNESYRIVSDFDWYLNALIKFKVSFTQFSFHSSVFFDGGLSTTNNNLLQEEYKDVIRKYFGPLELKIYSGRSFKFLTNFNIIRTFLVRLLHIGLNEERQSNYQYPQ